MGKKVIITGCSQGIGSGIAIGFHKAGWQVIGIDKQEPTSKDIAAVIDEFYKVDLTKREEIQEFAKLIKQDHPLINALVNNAGWNVFGEGSIVNISSIQAERTMPGMTVYAPTKAGLCALTRSLAIEYGPDGIRVNTILPGCVDTPLMNLYLDKYYVSPAGYAKREDREKEMAQTWITPRMGQPNEIASAVIYLADNDQSAFVTGTELVADGGWLTKLCM